MADSRDLTQEQASWLRKIVASNTAHDASGHYVIPDEVHDALVEKGYLRWERGVVFVTPAGAAALDRSPMP